MTVEYNIRNTVFELWGLSFYLINRTEIENENWDFIISLIEIRVLRKCILSKEYIEIIGEFLYRVRIRIRFSVNKYVYMPTHGENNNREKEHGTDK